MTTHLLGLINQSSLVTSPRDIEAMAEAVTKQIRRHAGPAWGVHSAPVVPVADSSLLPPGAVPLYLLDDPDQADALGYHTEDENGLVYGRIFARPVLDNGGGILDGGSINVSVSSVLSHEALEWLIDSTCSGWEGPAADGNLYAREIGDPVESDGYAIEVNHLPVLVSNFIFPEWFDPQAPVGARYDQLRLVNAPFTMTSGGYVITMKSGEVDQAFGADVPEWRKTTKEHVAARSARRLARAASPT